MKLKQAISSIDDLLIYFGEHKHAYWGADGKVKFDQSAFTAMPLWVIIEKLRAGQIYIEDQAQID